MLMPGMCSVLICAFDAHMKDIGQIRFQDWFNVIVMSVCCRAVSYQALSFKTLKGGLITKFIKYTSKAFIIHSLFTVFFVNMGFLNAYSIVRQFQIIDIFFPPRGTRRVDEPPSGYFDDHHCERGDYYCRVSNVELFYYIDGPSNIPCLNVTADRMILTTGLIQASCVIQSISLICVHHANLNL